MSVQFIPPSKYQRLANQTYPVVTRKIRRALPLAKLEHIGASSVPGLWSKGDLDIHVGVERKAFERAATALKAIGFVHFKVKHRDPDLRHFVVKGYKLDVGAQLVANGSEPSESFIKFRDLLLKHKELRAEYNKLKQNAVGLSHAKYRRIKGCFIEALLLVSVPAASRRKWKQRSASTR